MWVRGLKLKNPLRNDENHGVAPYVGAWIETQYGMNNEGECSVAPYVGAWIETCDYAVAFESDQVAPYVGAWIETVYFRPLPLKRCTTSHPMWVRGLKHTSYV